ncbi:DUF4249 domain-containing protein [Flaviaesturariibacter flavus]|uniref:DUF4249 domain-containing protein n=1 Tax=Flaviaesturariibacter flavus TaxID=2502780 RepID=A0A4R1BNE4_9BACT|nr:DUF4249 domain-containing protein [Flaviaesturariibacter flavus]TCJ19039.1 DUF4249 domain-containing protein [Flaviaesturariibacter flavus]
MKHLFFLLLGATLLAGCEKNVDFPLQDAAPKLVVEATIENGQPPLVFLTRSLHYFSTFSPELLANSFVHGATVEISNGTGTYRLREYTVRADTTNYFVSFYTVDSSSLGNILLGQLQTDYSLRIIADGEEYTAQTRIPAITKRIDSLWWRPHPRDSSDGKVQIMGKVTDPPGYGDYGRYWTRRNSEPYWPGRNSVFDDLVVDGTTYTLPIDPGIDRNSSDGFEERAFRIGDTMTVKLANIDRATYDFWRTMEYTYQSVGNPFSSPTRVLSNISNGALGYFGGYAAQYRTIIIR